MERPCGTAPRPTRERSDGVGSPWVVIVLEGDRGMQWSIPEGRSLGGAQVFWNRSTADVERFLSLIRFNHLKLSSKKHLYGMEVVDFVVLLKLARM